MKKLVIALILTCLQIGIVQAEETKNDSEELPGSDIRIYADKHNEIKEYRINGRVYMIKITPKMGIPYYLVDTDGDGSFDTRRSDLSPNMKIPSWVIFSW